MIIFDGTKVLSVLVREEDGEEYDTFLDVRDIFNYLKDEEDKDKFYLYSPTKKKDIEIASIEEVVVDEHYNIGYLSGLMDLLVSPDTTFIAENGDTIMAKNLTHAFNKLTRVQTATANRPKGIYSSLRKEPQHVMYKIVLKEEAEILADYFSVRALVK